MHELCGDPGFLVVTSIDMRSLCFSITDSYIVYNTRYQIIVTNFLSTMEISTYLYAL